MTWGLPVSVEVGGTEYPVRTDYRVILDILSAVADPELTGREKSYVALVAFYPDFEDMPPELYRDALESCFRFVNCDSEDAPHKAPKLVDWEQDYRLIIAPINRVAGQEVRSLEYMHWWTFLSAYYEIGDCTFAQVVRIRDHLARGKKLDKPDREWYQKNRQLVDFKNKYTAQDDDICREFSGV